MIILSGLLVVFKINNEILKYNMLFIFLFIMVFLSKIFFFLFFFSLLIN